MPAAGEPFNPRRLFYGVFIPEALLAAELPATAKLLYGLLARYAGAEGRCWPAQARLAAALHLTERSIRELLGRLEAAGLIRRRRRGATTDVYEFLWHPLFDTVPQRDPETGAGGPAEPTEANKQRNKPEETSGMTGSLLPVRPEVCFRQKEKRKESLKRKRASGLADPKRAARARGWRRAGDDPALARLRRLAAGGEL